MNQTYEDLKDPGETPTQNRPLPKVKNLTELSESDDILEPDKIIEGLLHQGAKMIIGAGSKSRKSWLALDMSLSIASGHSWLGFQCNAAKVLYCNLELMNWTLWDRVNGITEHHDMMPGDNLHVWNLRGHAMKLDEFKPHLVKQIQDGNFDVVVLDPIYKTGGGTNENDAGAVATLLANLDEITEQTGAAVVFVAHFSKGNQQSKDFIDRISGSGVWARDADVIMTLTKHEEEDCYAVETITRALKEPEPFVAEWTYPVFSLRNELDPEALKRPKPPTKLYDDDALLDLLDDSVLSSGEWAKKAHETLIMSSATFYRLRKGLIESGKVHKVNGTSNFRQTD